MFTFSTKTFYRALWAVLFLSGPPLSAQILISQYYEGDVNDKFIEITNVSGSAINPAVDNFFLCVFSNDDAGSPDGKKPGLSTKINMEIAPGQTVLYKNSLATSPAYAVNEGIGALIGAFNGNDVLVISTSKDETTWENRIDVIGNGEDWGIDKSFHRKITVKTPNVDYTPGEWTETTVEVVNQAPENSVERLGFHIYNCEKPTMAANGVSFSNISDTSLDISWIPGNGSSRLVVARAYQAVTSLPADGISYSASTIFGAGDPFDDGFIVHNSWENSFTLTNLTPSTPYFISVFEFDCSPPGYLTASFITGSETTLAPIPRIFTDLGTDGLDFGLVQPGNSGTAPEIEVSWVNLSSGISASVGAPFEISLDNNTWSGQTNLPFEVNGSVSLYIRFSPAISDGIHTSELKLNATGAAEVGRPLTGTAFPNAWINELHYEDIGADEGEFVEVVLQYAGNYDLSTLGLHLYNGSSGLVYDQQSLDNFTPGEENNNFMVLFWPTVNIQNGQPGGADGLALTVGGQLIQFLSYEGVFTAKDGPAAGNLSIDIGVEESDDTTVEGSSLQLTNEKLISAIQVSSKGYTDFSWVVATESPGLFNNNQVLPVELSNFDVAIENGVAILSWQTLSEVNNRGFEIQKSSHKNQFETIGFVKGNGTTSQPRNYNFSDHEFSGCSYYKLKQIDFDGQFNFSDVISLKRARYRSGQFVVSPNPVRQELHIARSCQAKSGSIGARLLTIHGKKILQSKGDLVKIKSQINGCLRNLQRGVYLLELQSGWQSEKHILLKE